MKEKILWPYLRQASRQLGWDEGVDWMLRGQEGWDRKEGVVVVWMREEWNLGLMLYRSGHWESIDLGTES